MRENDEAHKGFVVLQWLARMCDGSTVRNHVVDDEALREPIRKRETRDAFCCQPS